MSLNILSKGSESMFLDADHCNIMLVLQILYFLKLGYDILRIFVPILLIIMSGIELFKIITSSEADGKKEYNSVIKKVIAAIIIFSLTTFINMVMNLVPNNEYGNNFNLKSYICWNTIDKYKGIPQ